MKKICIVGSGLVGTLLAIFLAEAGFSVDVYEKRKDPRTDTKTRGRSIALSLSDRGWKALRQAGLENKVRTNTNPAYGRTVHRKDGTTDSQNYGADDQAIWTVNRNYLNTALLEKAMATGRVTFFFEHACEEINERTGDIIVDGPAIKERVRRTYDHIIGVDGVFSAVRNNLLEKNLWAFGSSTLYVGYKELHLPPNAKGDYAFANHRIHIWPRKNSFLIAFPAAQGNFASTLFLPMEGPDSLATLTTPALFKIFFEKEYKELVPLMPDLLNDFSWSPASTITEVKVWPWHHEDKVLIMGDAAHAIAPFYGMGMNIGFEDCTVFMELLKKNNNDFEKTFARFDKARKPDTDAMHALSQENFEGLNKSSSPAYCEKWRIERRLWKLAPEQWTPPYVLVAFTETPLREIPAMIERQGGILDKMIAAHPGAAALTDAELLALAKEG